MIDLSKAVSFWASSREFIKRNQPFLNIANFFVLLITAIFVILYWAATQEMKKQMVKQSKLYEKSVEQMVKQSGIQVQSNEITLMPILDIDLKFNYKDDPNKYNIILHNKGKGPANVSLCRINIQPSKISQIMGLTNAQLEARTYTKPVGALGSGESKILRSESDIAYKCMTVEINLRDLFRNRHRWVFEVEPDGFRLVDFPSLDDFKE